MFSEKMVHADIPLPMAQVHSTHPFKNEKSHKALLEYVESRLCLGKQVRDSQVTRFAQIDKDMAGWMILSDEDRKRQIKHERDGTPQALTVSLPLTFVHIDDMMTYFAATFSPNRGMFYHTGKPSEANEASQIVTLMNNHAIYSGAYRQVLLAVFSVLKYNLGGFYGYWSKDQGPNLTKNGQGETIVETVTKWQGNKLEALDIYNTFYDPSVHPTQMHIDGEFVGRSFMRSHYWLKNKASQGFYFNVEESLKQDNGINECKYYRHPPAEANMQVNESGASNWVSILSESPEHFRQTGFELTEIFIRLNPYQMNLVPRNPKTKAERNRYEVWRITLLNGDTIIDTTYMNNVHGYLPFFFGLINDDLMGTSQKSISEILQPLQDFASFLLNAHIQASRKNIWGITIYDPTVVDLKTIPSGEVNARIPVKPAGYGKDLRQHVLTTTGQLDTKQTMGDLESTMGIINQFFPTQSLPSQIASIDRAVDSQVAAVQQGANRRQQKAARLLDDTMFRALRFAFYYNILQFQEDGATVHDFYGKPVTINLDELRATDLPFIIGQGLKAVDRQAAAGSLQQIIFALIQSPQTAERIDILGLIDYWTNMIDIDVDMTQFHIQPPAAAAAVPGTQPAEGGAAIVPVTNPEAVTSPIYG